MHKVIDCAWDLSEHAADIRAAGVETVIRYYNHRNSRTLPTKRLEQAEAQSLADAGLAIGVVFQQRGGVNGHIEDLDRENGRADAARALELADKIGQPQGSAIYFAIDHDYFRQSELDRIKPYFEAAATALQGKYKVGLYGSGTQGKTMRDAGFVEMIWLAGARGWSGTRDMLRTDQWALFQEKLDARWPGRGFAYDGNAISPAWPDYGQFSLGDADTSIQSAGPADVLMEIIARRGLNLRGGPDESYAAEATLPYGTLVHVLGREGDWLKVDVEGDGVADGFMHGSFLQAVSGGLPSPTIQGDRPYDVARAELAMDVIAVPGPRNNPRIVMYHRSTNQWSGTDDDVHWCSSFVNYCVEQAGLEGTNRQNARSWVDWSTDVTASPQEGDIAVFSRGRSRTNGHVGFFVEDRGDTIAVLGGNQSRRVKVSNYTKDGPKNKLLSIRRP